MAPMTIMDTGMAMKNASMMVKPTVDSRMMATVLKNPTRPEDSDLAALTRPYSDSYDGGGACVCV